MNGHHDHASGEPCDETEALMAKLRAAGVPCERATLADVVATDMPLFFYPGDFK